MLCCGRVIVTQICDFGLVALVRHPTKKDLDPDTLLLQQSSRWGQRGQSAGGCTVSRRDWAQGPGAGDGEDGWGKRRIMATRLPPHHAWCTQVVEGCSGS